MTGLDIALGRAAGHSFDFRGKRKLIGGERAESMPVTPFPPYLFPGDRWPLIRKHLLSPQGDTAQFSTVPYNFLS